MYIKQDFDFDDLMENCWGQASEILQEIYDKDKEDEFMEFLENEFSVLEDNIPDLTVVNDLIAYEWEYIYKQINMNDEDDE